MADLYETDILVWSEQQSDLLVTLDEITIETD
jgi:hypothetical protein